MVHQVFAVILTYTAAAWAWISYSAGTCTGNDAGQLSLIVLSIPLYLLAAFCFARSPRGGAAQVAALAILPAVLWQVGFSVWLAFHLIYLGTEACSLVFGAPYGFDGNEVLYATLWLLPLLAIPFALVLRRR